jgi:hypothetical protein
MKNLLYKEFRLAISPLFFAMPLFGALLLIPQWVYFVALMYFFFIAVPNLFTVAKAQGDLAFSLSLPVRRADIVSARIIAVILLELLQIAATAVFALINRLIYPVGNFLMDANIAFFGFAFMMYGLYNIVLFPMFYKTADKIAWPSILSTCVTVFFAGIIEVLVASVPSFRALDGWGNIPEQVVVLVAGVASFALLSFAALKLSIKRFEKVNI